MAWVTRTGLTTAKFYAKALRKVLQKYLDWYSANLTEPEVDAINALIAACTAFIDNVRQYESDPIPS